jgi:hypothetical protein
MGGTAGHGVLEGAVQMQVTFVMIVTALINTQGRLAQLVERLVYTENVGGSSPSPPIHLVIAKYLWRKHLSQR